MLHAPTQRRQIDQTSLCCDLLVRSYPYNSHFLYKATMKWGSLCFRNDLRYHCLVIGYMNLLASIVDILFHLLVTCIVSNGFQCDPNFASISALNRPWLEPILLIINIGTHGFYPFPLTLRFNNHGDMMAYDDIPKCYPGMLHVSLVDVLDFTINVIWLKFVISYVSAVHKRNPEPMRVFFGLSVVKLVIQVIYFGYQPSLYGPWPKDPNWIIKIIDICTAAVFIIIINKYIRVLTQETASKAIDQPPSYVECLMGSTKTEPNVTNENSDQVAIIIVSNEEHEIGDGKKEIKLTKE